MNKAIVVGAGKIGRGFVGMELERAGYHVLFVDMNEDIVNEIRRRGEYVVSVLDADRVETTVRNISAMSSLDPALPERFADEELSLVCTSVGQTALAKVAPMIAAGISRRQAAGVAKPLNVIAVENAMNGSSQLKAHVYARLAPETIRYADAAVGFPNCAVDRIVPPGGPGARAVDVAVEKYFEWDVDRKGLKAPLLPVDGMSLVDNLDAFLERKIFTLNGPNAVTACYGWIKGCETINEALEDSAIYEVVWGMMEECGRMLSLRHGFSEEEMSDYRSKVMRRFRNPYILDSVARVAREPIRKLSPNDRIIAPFNYAKSYGLPVECYRVGIACVLSYDNPDDAQSVKLQEMISGHGPRGALELVSGIPAESQDALDIEAEYRRLNNK